MHALSEHENFHGWYGTTWHKRELLDRRHRADCDPFIDIANVLEKPTTAKVIAYTREELPRTPRTVILTPDSVDNKWKQLLAKAGHDQHLVSRPIPFYFCVHNILRCSKLGHFHTCVHKR
jgi:hypothetical protein